MRRPIATVVVVAWALGLLAAGPAAWGDHDRRGRGGPPWAREEADRRLREAERDFRDAQRHLEGLLAARAAAQRDLAAVERELARSGSGYDFELRRLQRELDEAVRQARGIEGDVARLRHQADAARRAAEGARAEYFRRAESSPVMRDAWGRVSRAEFELESARRWALQHLRDSWEWRSALGRREAARERLDRTLWRGASAWEINRLRDELAMVEDRLKSLEHEAATCDPRVLEAQARLESARRGVDEARAAIERELAYDRAYASATADALRFERDAEYAARALQDAETDIRRIQRQMDHLRPSPRPGGFHDRDAQALRLTLDRLERDIIHATERLRRAEYDLARAR